MSVSSVTIPDRCDAELLCDLFDLLPHQRDVVIAGTASEHINAKLDLIRKFRISAEGIALLTRFPTAKDVAAAVIEAQTVEVAKMADAFVHGLPHPVDFRAVETFVRTQCKRDEGEVGQSQLRERKGDLFGAYLTWCEQVQTNALSERDFSRAMRAIGFNTRHSDGAWWIGIMLLEPAEASLATPGDALADQGRDV